MTPRPVASLLFVVGLLLAVACQRSRPAPAGKQAQLPLDVAALVGADPVDLKTVLRVAEAGGVPLGVARDRAVFDALLAASGREHLGRIVVRHAETAANARLLLQDFAATARAAGPPTDDEVAQVTETRWWELDRPALRRTTHAVVLVDKPEQEKPARALADRILAAVQGATDVASFRSLAAAVPAAGLSVKVEDLDPATEDGRSVNPAAPPPPGSQSGRYSPAYVAAAFAIPGLLRLSPVVRSEFGFHVILLTQLLPEQRMPLEDRRRLLEPDVQIRRAVNLEKDAIERARSVNEVKVERSAAELTAKVAAQL